MVNGLAEPHPASSQYNTGILGSLVLTRHAQLHLSQRILNKNFLVAVANLKVHLVGHSDGRQGLMKVSIAVHERFLSLCYILET